MNLVMLDIDGTLTQSYEYDWEVFKLAIHEALGFPLVSRGLDEYVDKTSLGVTVEATQRMTGRSPSAKEVEAVKRRVLYHLNRKYQESPASFGEVPGASHFLERLRKLKGVGIAIATGCWRSEALFKLQASGLSAGDIPMATSDNEQNRKRIMKIAALMALDFYNCIEFERVVYLGDGPWDLQTSHSLGYGFIGIGPRVKGLNDLKLGQWHQDYMDVEAVLKSVTKALKP